MKCQAHIWNITDQNFEKTCKHNNLKNSKHCLYHLGHNPVDVDQYYLITEAIKTDEDYYNHEQIKQLVNSRNMILHRANPGMVPLTKYVRLKGKKFLWIDTYAIVDPEDFDEVMKYRWYLSKIGYAMTKFEGVEVEMGAFVLAMAKRDKRKFKK